MSSPVAQPLITIRPSAERGLADHGWLRSRHTFSFADYDDPAHMGFRSLRVINEDIVAAGRGFPEHPHSDMEIFSYVLQGSLAHRDSLGNERILEPGQILQIWIQPRMQGLRPSYTEWHPPKDDENSPKILVISPDSREGSACIQQDVSVYRLRLQPGQSACHELAEGHALWLQMATGAAEFNSCPLESGDGASATESGTFTLTASQPTEALLFDFQ
jgi:redox-sensitive bicupin YhaK (pirin superfamily)